MKKTALTTTSVQGSHLLHVKDLILNEFFLIDRGAEISIVKPTPLKKRSKAHSELISVDGSPYQRMVIALWICVLVVFQSFVGFL